MNCLQYKGYMLVVGKIPQLTKSNQKEISEIVTISNYKDIIKLIDNI